MRVSSLRYLLKLRPFRIAYGLIKYFNEYAIHYAFIYRPAGKSVPACRQAAVFTFTFGSLNKNSRFTLVSCTYIHLIHRCLLWLRNRCRVSNFSIVRGTSCATASSKILVYIVFSFFLQIYARCFMYCMYYCIWCIIYTYLTTCNDLQKLSHFHSPLDFLDVVISQYSVSY